MTTAEANATVGDAPQAFAGTGGPSVGFVPIVKPVGIEILVNTATTGLQDQSQTTALANGGFVVTWRDNSKGVGGNTGDNNNYATKAQVFTTTGAPVGGEILVNTAIVRAQESPQITALENGGFVITWSDYSLGVGGAGGDTSDVAVKAQVFAADGAKMGGEIRVNSATAGIQIGQQITALADGGFVITWQDASLGVGGATGDSSGTAVKAQVFAADGTPAGSEILVNTITAGYQTGPLVTALHDGGFIVTWGDGDASAYALKARLFSSGGTPAAGEFVLDPTAEYVQGLVKVATLESGGFVVVWDDYNSVGAVGVDTTGRCVKMQMFSQAGAKVGGELQVNTATASNQWGSKVAALTNGGFVIGWGDESLGVGGAGGDTSLSATKVQMFAADGTKLGGEIRVNTATAGNQGPPMITALPDGGFVVSWGDDSRGVGGAGGDKSGYATKAQVFSANGTPIGGEILVNTATNGAQTPSGSVAVPGGFVIIWQDRSLGVGGTGGDTNGPAVKAQVFAVGPHAFEGAALDLKNSGFRVADPDATDILTVTLSVDYGVLTVTAGTSGAQVAGSGTAAVTITGTAAQIAALLNSDATSTLRYLASFGATPDAALITFTANDGLGGVASTTVIVPITASLQLTGDGTGETLAGGAGSDQIAGLGGDDLLDGGDGDDVLDGGDGDDTLVGGAGADYLRGGFGADDLAGGAGDDTYIVDDAGDVITEALNGGTDTVQARVSWVLGDNTENLILGSSGGEIDGTGNGLNNVITGNAKTNVLLGLGGDDTLVGDGGNDVLYGGAGADTLDGGQQNDTLNGGADNDHLIGGAGNDTLEGGTGVDVMEGGAGNDSYIVDQSSDVVIEDLNGGTDTVEASATFTLGDNVEHLTLTGSGDIDGTGNSLRNIITGNSGANTLHGGDELDTLLGLAGDDHLYGDAGNDILDGGDDDDTLDGGAGVDTLVGGAGDDVLIGGVGNDKLTGGAGADIFRFTGLDLSGGTVERDQVFDLSFADGDVIDLSGIDANANLAGDQAFVWATKFTKVAGQAVLKYAAATGLTTLELDIDGDGKADFRVAITGDHSSTTGNLYVGAGDSNGGWLL